MNYGKPTMWRLAILFIMSTFTFSACSTFKKAEAPTPKASAPKPSSKKGDMKAFSDVITDKAISDEGVFTVHKVDENSTEKCYWLVEWQEQHKILALVGPGKKLVLSR